VRSSTRIAADFSDCFPDAIPPMEASFPAYIPEAFQEEEKIREFLNLNPAMRRIYGDAEPLINQLDGIITSVGGFPKEIPFEVDEFDSMLLFSEHIPEEKVKELIAAGIIGNILGYCIIERGKTPNDIVTKTNDRFLGPRPQHLIKCAGRARKEDNIGVMIVASGKKKAEVLCTVIQDKYADEIVIDSELAKELKRQL
jgi:DNA-binding transcriptional regulator LsrR (DeoR family)